MICEHEQDLPEDRFGFLKTAALTTGADEAVIIPASLIAVEDRVGLKCRNGCPSYGRSLTCPPYVPDIHRFRAILSEYSYAMIIRFRSSVTGEEAVVHSILRCLFDPEVQTDQREQAGNFVGQLAEESRNILKIMLDLERIAFNAGYPLAFAISAGACRLCKTCNVEGGVCRFPTRARFSAESVGVNVVKTAEQTGMQIRFPVPIPPDRITILLIA